MYKLPARQIIILFHFDFTFHIFEPQLYYTLRSLTLEFPEFLEF